MRYRYNPYCSCSRCRAHGYMGPAVLITLGVLFLLDQLGHARWMDFSSTWPALLIVIGLVLFLRHNASAYDHVPREYGAMPPQGQPIPPGTGVWGQPTNAGGAVYPGQPGGMPVYPAPPQAPVVTPPPTAPAEPLSYSTPPTPPSESLNYGTPPRSDDQEGHNG